MKELGLSFLCVAPGDPSTLTPLGLASQGEAPTSLLFSLSVLQSVAECLKCIFIRAAYLTEFDKVGIKDHNYRSGSKKLVTLRNRTNLLVQSALCCNAFYFSYHVKHHWVP